MQAPDATWQGPWPSGWSVDHVPETGSTNADLLAAARSGAPHRQVLAASHQTAGRGRLDRTWDAPPGANLLVSLLFREDLDRPHTWTQRVALAAAVAVDTVAGARATLKWPNDLLLGEAKLAGILAQAESRQGTVDHVVVGLGLNVGWAPPGAARLGRGTPPEVLWHVLDALDRMPSTWFADYRRRLDTLGRAVRVELPGESLIGEAVDVLEDGALVVRGPLGRRVVQVGDVVHLRVTNR